MIAFWILTWTALARGGAPAYTPYILLAVTLFLVGWDIYVAMVKPRDTISADVLALSRRFPFVLLAAGILVGHLFWPQVSCP